MRTIEPGDRLVIGGGLFRSVVAIQMTVDVREVTLRDLLTKRMEKVSLVTLESHLASGWVERES